MERHSVKGPRMYPPDGGLKKPVRKFEDTFSVTTVLKETFFPDTLTEKEKQQIARRDAPQAARDDVIEQVAFMLEREYPDNVNTNAFCAAIRSMKSAR